MKSLIENCKRRNAPLHAFPEINGRRVNLFVLYMMVQKLGGGETVTRSQQWALLAQKLQLPDESAQQLATIYYHVLLPYEQYLSTPEGIKETQSKRLFLQQFFQELLKKILSLQNNNTLRQPTGSANTNVSPGANSPNVLEASKLAAKKARKNRVKKKTKKEIEREMQQQQQNLQVQHQLQQEQQAKLLLNQQMKQQELQRVPPQNPSNHINDQESHKTSPMYRRTFARNYVPMSRPLETSNGYDIKAISQVGEKIDANKPIFLFAPELGTINLHTLTMSLRSGRLSEVNVALNTLLVTSADALLKIPLSHCEGLADSLAILGCELLKKLCEGRNISPQREIKYLDEYDVEELLNKDNSSHSSDDYVFEKVFHQYFDKENVEIKIKVDSLTGEDLNQKEPNGNFKSLELGQQDEMNENNNILPVEFERWDYLPQPLCFSDDPTSWELSIPSYLSALRSVRDEIDDPFTKVNTRGVEDSQILVVDQLSTISMIIRNLSFSESNTSVIASNQALKRFMLNLISALFVHSDKFVFHRKCLNFKKDIIITLSNVGHLLQIESAVEACMLLFLVLSFKEGKSYKSLDSLIFPESSVKFSKYQGFSADVLAKLMSLGYPNRVFIKSVLLNQFDTDVESRDVTACQRLLSLYRKLDANDNSEFKIYNDVFSLLISTIPFQQLNSSPTLIEEVAPTISQSVTALISLVSFIDKESLEGSNVNLPYLWLTSQENVGSNLRRLSEALSNIGIHTNNNLRHLKLLFNSISAKSLELVRLIIEKCIELTEGPNGNSSQRSEIIRSLLCIPNLLPSENISFSLLTNPLADVCVVKQMYPLYRLRNDLLSEIDENNS